MEQITKDTLLDVIKTYVESKESNKKPMLIWFQSKTFNILLPQQKKKTMISSFGQQW